MPTNTNVPDRGHLQRVLFEKTRNGYMLEDGRVSSANVQTVLDALDADPSWRGDFNRGCAVKRESRAYLVALKAEKVAAGL